MVAFFIIMNQVSVTAFRGEHVGTPQTGSHLAQFNIVVVPNVLAQCLAQCLTNDSSVLELIDSEYSVVNERLAQHYEIARQHAA